MRMEKDSLGELPVPDNAYYGIQTVRCAANYDVTDHTFNELPHVIRAMAEIKKACAVTNKEIGALDSHRPVTKSLRGSSRISSPSMFGAAMVRVSI